MPLSKETELWLQNLKSEGNLDDEAYGKLKSSLEANAKADEYVKGSQLRQADYSRHMSEVQKAQKELETATAALATKETAVTKYQAELGTWKAGADEAFKKALAEKEKAENRAVAAVNKLKTLAAAAGIPEEELNLSELTTVIKKEETPPFDTSKFVTRDNVAAAARESALVEGTLLDLAEEYRELFGTRIPGGGAKLVEEALQAGKTVREYFNTKFKIEEVRAKKGEEAIENRIKEETDKRVMQFQSEHSIPEQRPGLQGSPLFKKDGLPTPTKESVEGGGIAAAVAAFNSRKYDQSAK